VNTNAEKNISTKQSPPSEETRLQTENVIEEWSSDSKTSSGERSQAFDSGSLQLLDQRFPKSERLLKPAQFRAVYNRGKKFDARFLNVFLLPNDKGFHRVGITASKKGIGNAVQRNRAKRLLRETFRLSKPELLSLHHSYDFVFNCKRSLLKVKLEQPLSDFRGLISRIIKFEITNENTIILAE
jgi:ribonuclease P protein component